MILIAIPLIVAIIVKLGFKKQFFDVLWKSPLFIAIPLSLLGTYGVYYKGKNLPAAIQPESDPDDELKRIAEQWDQTLPKEIDGATTQFDQTA